MSAAASFHQGAQVTQQPVQQQPVQQQPNQQQPVSINGLALPLGNPLLQLLGPLFPDYTFAFPGPNYFTMKKGDKASNCCMGAFKPYWKFYVTVQPGKPATFTTATLCGCLCLGLIGMAHLNREKKKLRDTLEAYRPQIEQILAGSSSVAGAVPTSSVGV